MAKQLKLWGGLVISLGSIWLALQGIDFGKVGSALGNINWFWILIYFLPFWVVFVLKITRWRLLFYPDHRRMSYNHLFGALMISYLWNTILPARLGEVVRGYVISRNENVGLARSFSTILLEKILDIITLIIFLLALLPFIQIQDNVRQPALILGGAVVVAFLVCMLMAARRREAEIFIQFFLKRLPPKLSLKLHSFVTEILDTLAVLLNFKVSLNLWFQSLLLWLVNSTLLLLLAWALGLNLDYGQAVLVMITSNLGMAVPSSPGYVGTFELVIKITLLPFFPGQESLLVTYALLAHLASFGPLVIFGAYFSWKEGLSLGKVKATSGNPAGGGEAREELAPRKAT